MIRYLGPVYWIDVQAYVILNRSDRARESSQNQTLPPFQSMLQSNATQHNTTQLSTASTLHYIHITQSRIARWLLFYNKRGT